MYKFSDTHPKACAVYFISVMVLSMFCHNPVIVIASLIGSILFNISLTGFKRFSKSLWFYIFIFLIVSVTNPLFSHNGNTQLFFINNNAITLEAIIYGINLSLMLINIIIWFSNFNLIFTEEKLLYLLSVFGKKLSLLISSALRFVPLLKRQAQKIKNSQKAMGLYSTDNIFLSLKSNIRVISALIGWALENAVDTGNSMNARGYLLKGRTFYSSYKFSVSDMLLIAIVLFCDILVISGLASGRLDFSFYPAVTMADTDVLTIISEASFFILSLLPFTIQTGDNLRWKYLKSKI